MATVKFGSASKFTHTKSDRENFLLLVGQYGVDLFDVLVGLVLDFLLSVGEIVLRYLAVFLELLDGVNPMAAFVANRDPTVLGHFLNHLVQLAAALLIKLRDR